MHPVLISLGPIQIHSYGLLIVVGFIVAIVLVRSKARKTGLSATQLTDIGFWCLITGLVGARILFVMTQWHTFAHEPMRMFKFWEGGVVFYGGFIAGALTFVLLARRMGIPVLKGTDIAAPSVAIAHMFGRLGCFAAGCCYGRSLDPDHPFAVIFQNPSAIAPRGLPIHPAQLYDATNALLIFILLQWLYVKRRFDGQVTAVYLMLYAIGRSVVETYRGDSVRGFVIENVLSTSQFISIFVFIAGFALYYWQWRKTVHPLATRVS